MSRRLSHSVGLQQQLDEVRQQLDGLAEALNRRDETIEKLRKENAQLRDQLNVTQEQLTREQRKNARQAGPFRRRDSAKIPEDQKKRPGRQPGHPGVSRAKPEHVDQEIEVPLSGCPQCGQAVEDCSPLVQYIEEIPPVQPIVTRLVTWQARCRCCGPVRSAHPLQTSTAQGAAAVNLGPRAWSVATMLNKQLGLSMRNTCRILEQLFGLKLSPGGLSQALDRIADQAQPVYQQLQEEIRDGQASYTDETSWWVGGPGHWLWTFTSPETTVYRVADNRGAKVVREVLGNEFAGVLVSDCLRSYDPLDYRKHKCIAHHLQAISQARQRSDTHDPSYLDQWMRLFQQVIRLWNCRAAYSESEWAQERQWLRAWSERLLGEPVQQPGDLAIQKRLAKQQAHLLVCLEEPNVEPTNNRAERSLRPAVIARKLSCGNRTDRGRRTWEVLASLAATWRQRGADFIELIHGLVSHQDAAPAG